MSAGAAGSFLAVSVVAMLASLATTRPCAAQPAPSSPPRPTSAAAAEPRFDILEFVVVGDTLLGAGTIERVVYPFLGPGRGIADAQAARKALEAAYQDAGYLSVSVLLPEQRVDGAGEVRLEVVASAVDKLRITGAEFHLPSRIEAGLPSLAPGSVPDFNQMQLELAQLAREAPLRELTPIVSAGDRPAVLNVEIKVQDRLPLQASVELNNKQSLDTVAGRLEAAVSYDNLFQRGHSVGLSWFHAPRRASDADIQSLSYAWPLGGASDRATLVFTNSDSSTPTAIGGATVSRGQTWRLRWRDEGPARPGLSQALNWGLVWRDLRDRSVGANGTAVDAPPLRYATVSLGGELTLLRGDAADGATSLSAELSSSVPGIARREVDCFGVVREQFGCKRDAAGPRFQVLSFGATHRQPIGRMGLLLRLQAQYSDTPLVSSEQFTAGGQDSVRGYLEGEQSGDLGAALRVELSTPAWSVAEGLAASGWLFHDAAALRRLSASAEEQARPRLRSAGLGLRVDSRRGLQLRLAWARVLGATNRLVGGVQQPVSGPGSDNTQRWELSVRQPF